MKKGGREKKGREGTQMSTKSGKQKERSGKRSSLKAQTNGGTRQVGKVSPLEFKDNQKVSGEGEGEGRGCHWEWGLGKKRPVWK